MVPRCRSENVEIKFWWLDENRKYRMCEQECEDLKHMSKECDKLKAEKREKMGLYGETRANNSQSRYGDVVHSKLVAYTGGVMITESAKKSPYRNRGQSTGSLDEFLKRKRLEKGGEVEQDNELFKKSKVTLRTPEKTPEKRDEGVKEASMNAIMEVLKELTSEVKEIREDMKSSANEIKMLRTEMAKNELKWEEERKLLQTKIETVEKELASRANEKKEEESARREITKKIELMELKMEKRDKMDRKNNIVIKNATWEGNDYKKEVQKFLEEVAGVNVHIEDAFKISKTGKKTVTLVKMRSKKKKG
ncbi:hypothetical protein FQR65_LT13911 [Abscondita terminalis]|nr:hypothetical protein FQR65_LT13911 [Abscondita terminalis]